MSKPTGPFRFTRLSDIDPLTFQRERVVLVEVAPFNGRTFRAGKRAAGTFKVAYVAAGAVHGAYHG